MCASILLAIQQATVREFLSAHLQHAGFITIHTQPDASLPDVLAMVAPDLVIIDARADAATIAALCGRVPALRCLVLGQPAEKYRFSPQQILPTPVNGRTLLDKVNAQLRTCPAMLDAEAIHIDGLSLDIGRHEVRCRDQRIVLGSREFGLLRYLMQHPERVHSRDCLLSRVWGEDIANTERSVDVTVRRLRAALEPHGFGERIETVRGAGYRFQA